VIRRFGVWTAVSLACLAAWGIAGLPCSASASAQGRIEVFAGIPPVAYLAERIGGAHVNVNVMLNKGRDAHTFEPTPRQVMDLADARVYFEVGIPFERRLVEKIASGAPALKVVDVTQGIRKLPMEAHGHGGHSHREGWDESDGATDGSGAAGGDPDPHVWLSPPLVKVMAGNIRDALVAIDPGNAEEYRANCRALVRDLERVDEKVREMLAPFEGRSFYVFHPAFGYFADAYGLRQEAVETGGKSPTPRTLSNLIEKARAEGVRTIFVQPQFDTNSARAIASAIGGRVVTLDALPEDIPGGLVDMASKIRDALADSVETEGER